MFFVFFHTSFVVSVLLCFVREQMRKNQRPKERKNREKRGSKKDQKISSLEESQQNENKRRLLSPYIYTHTSLRTESVHKNREGTLSLSLSFCTALFLYTS